MAEQKRKPDFILILICIIAVLAVGLGTLQFHWIDNSTKGTEFQLYANLNNSAAQILRSVRLQTSWLSSFIYLDQEEINSEDYRELSESLAKWRNTTVYPELLDRMYLYNPPSPGSEENDLHRWNEDEATFEQIPKPTFFAQLDQILFETQPVKSSDIQRVIQDDGLFLIIHVSGLLVTGPEGRVPNPTFLIVELSHSTLFKEILPAYMDIYLQDYYFTITGPGGGEDIIFRKGEDLDGRQPELSLPMEQSFFLPYESRVSQNSEEFSADVLFQLWSNLFENHDDIDTQAEGTSKAHLNIFYPGQNISTQIKHARKMNLILSFGFLALFLTVLAILYRLYRKTRALRVRERNFISSMSHELRTPIAVIRSTSKTLEKGIVKDPERIKLYSKTIMTQADRLGESVDGILKYSGLIRSPEETLTVQRHNISNMTAEAAETMEVLIAEKGGILIRNIQPDIFLKINVEGFRLILENFLSNAVKHGLTTGRPENDPGEIRIDLKNEEGYTILSVADNGPGVYDSEKKKIFNAFYRGIKSRESQTPGSGLGLNLVKQTAGMLGGTVEVTSPRFPDKPAGGRGTIFTARLPLIPEIINHR